MEGLRLIKAGDNQGWQCGAAPLRARSAIVLWGGEGGGGGLRGISTGGRRAARLGLQSRMGAGDLNTVKKSLSAIFTLLYFV